MMLEPSIDSLMEKIDSKYMLVTLSAKRARQLQNMGKNDPKKEGSSQKYIGIALHEIITDELTYTTDEG